MISLLTVEHKHVVGVVGYMDGLDHVSMLYNEHVFVMPVELTSCCFMVMIKCCSVKCVMFECYNSMKRSGVDVAPEWGLGVEAAASLVV